MFRKLGCLMIVLTLAAAASDEVHPGAISGVVKNSTGTPQMGATVEVITSGAVLQAQTDAKGFSSLKRLLPGVYSGKVSSPSFLPAIREKINLQSGSSLIVNVTLNTLF